MDERSVPRTVADLSVPAQHLDRDILIQIYNLSSSGCMFETVEPVQENEPIQIMLVDDITARGHVFWSQKSFAGVHFMRPLHAAVIQHLGFQEPSYVFDLWAPEDRFGRRLPPVSLKCSPTAQ